MQRILIAIISFVAVGFAIGYATACLGGPVESSWRVRVPEAGGASYGSGTAIGERFIITNAHVSPRCSKTPNCEIIKPHTGESYPCQTVSVDPSKDLALLYVATDGITLDYIELASTSQTTTVVNYGYGGDGVLCSGSGQALGVSEQQSGVGVYSFAVGLRSGDSGGGVFNSAEELVAVQWGTDGQRGVSTAVEDVHTFLIAFTEQTGFAGPWCPGGQCRPQQPQGGIGSGRPMRPVNPQNPPQTQPTNPQNNCQAEIDELNEHVRRIDEIFKRYSASLDKLNGSLTEIEVGLQEVRRDLATQATEPGKPGQDGQDGKDGKDAVVDYDRIVAEVVAAIVSNSDLRGEPGPKGDKGDPGSDGQTPTIDLDALADKLAPDVQAAIISRIRAKVSGM